MAVKIAKVLDNLLDARRELLVEREGITSRINEIDDVIAAMQKMTGSARSGRDYSLSERGKNNIRAAQTVRRERRERLGLRYTATNAECEAAEARAVHSSQEYATAV